MAAHERPADTFRAKELAHFDRKFAQPYSHAINRATGGNRNNGAGQIKRAP